MAGTWINPKLESVSASLSDDIAQPYRLTTTWTAVETTGGTVVVATTTELLTTPAALIQGQWDAIYADASTSFDTMAGGTSTAINPVVV